MLAAVVTWLVVTVRRGSQAGDRSLENNLAGLRAELVQKQMDGLVSLRESLDSASRLLNERLSENTGMLDRRMEVLGEIQAKLGQLEVQTRNIETIGRNIASLSDLLRPPKSRGTLGELLLENLLGEILPGNLYETQYRFADGHRVDAVVRIADRLLPIDSKFPLESYQAMLAAPESEPARKELVRALKKHIDDIAGRYIQPRENTTEIALMYIPSEAIYGEFIGLPEDDGMGYALSRKVVPTSPGHLYAFLASLAAVFAEAGLVSQGRRLVAGLDSLTESLTKLTHLQTRMEGSLGRLGSSLRHARDETTAMTAQVEHLRRPADELTAPEPESET